MENLKFTNKVSMKSKKTGVSNILLICGIGLILLSLIVILMEGFSGTTFTELVIGILCIFIFTSNGNKVVEGECNFSISSEKIILDYPSLEDPKTNKKAHVKYDIPLNSIDAIFVNPTDIAIIGKYTKLTEIDGQIDTLNSNGDLTLFYPNIAEMKEILRKYVDSSVMAD